MGRTFFGLTSEHKIEIHKTIFALAYFGNGGFTFDQIYNMPIYLRNFYMKQLEDSKKREMEMMKPKDTKTPLKR